MTTDRANEMRDREQDAAEATWLPSAYVGEPCRRVLTLPGERQDRGRITAFDRKTRVATVAWRDGWTTQTHITTLEFDPTA